MITEFEQQLIGEIVTDNIRTSKIFTELGIDFCCGGKQTVKDVCLKENIDIHELYTKIENIKEISVLPSQDFKQWGVTFLIDYIINVHHKFVLNTLPDLLFYTQKIANVHGQNHPELEVIAQKVNSLNTELRNHLQEEEEVLFPSIKQLESNQKIVSGKEIKDVIERLFNDHDLAGNTLDEINKVSNGYSVPEDGCNSYKVAFETLKKFEEDLHIHVHLENNILFPKVLKLVDSLS